MKSEIEQYLHSLTRSQQNYVESVFGGTALWAPQSAPQWRAMLSNADELFYGGQAGGGKTDLLLGCALSLHTDAVIFRREYRQMTGARGIIDRSRELIGSRGRYNGHEHVWRDLPGGRSLEFGSIQYEADKYNWMGRPHDLIGFDEITEFTASQYDFVIRWNRSIIPGQRCRVIAAGNPPMHSDGRWVIDYWGPWLDEKHPNPAMPGELRYFATIDGESVEVGDPDPIDHDGEEIIPTSRTFIPASLDDNPYLGDDYRARLQSAPEPLRSQLLYGDFSLSVDDHEYQVIPTKWVKAAQERWTPEPPTNLCDAMGVDPSRGGKDEFAMCLRYGTWFSDVIAKPATDAPDGKAGAALITAALLAADCEGNPAINIDVIGIGSSVYDHTKEILTRVRGVNFAAGSSATDKSGLFAMRNIRAEAWWALRETLDPVGGDDIALPPDRQLLADLTAPRYRVTTGGITVEEKDDIKARLNRSPDRGEAVVLAHYIAPSPPIPAGETIAIDPARYTGRQRSRIWQR